MSSKVLLGILIFLALASSPFWMDLMSSEESSFPILQYPPGEKECVVDRETMRADHMEVLNDWRDRVVRGEERYITIGGKKYEMSLTKACLSCHDNKEQFCDQCHNYLNVKPYCWDCHIENDETELKQDILDAMIMPKEEVMKIHHSEKDTSKKDQEQIEESKDE